MIDCERYACPESGGHLLFIVTKKLIVVLIFLVAIKLTKRLASVSYLFLSTPHLYKKYLHLLNMLTQCNILYRLIYLLVFVSLYCVIVCE